MKSISATITPIANALSDAGAFLLLVEFSVPNTPTSFYVRNNENVLYTYNGENYNCIGMEFGEIVETLQGDLPSFTLRISNASRTFAARMELYNGMLGYIVTIKVVHSLHLDLAPELTYVFEVLEAEQNDQWVTLTLGIPNPLTKRFPRDRHVPSLCRFVFKGAYCQYTGSASTCNHTLTQCRTYNNSLHFGGSPGIAEDVYGG